MMEQRLTHLQKKYSSKPAGEPVKADYKIKLSKHFEISSQNRGNESTMHTRTLTIADLISNNKGNNPYYTIDTSN